MTFSKTVGCGLSMALLVFALGCDANKAGTNNSPYDGPPATNSNNGQTVVLQKNLKISRSNQTAMDNILRFAAAGKNGRYEAYFSFNSLDSKVLKVLKITEASKCSSDDITLTLSSADQEQPVSLGQIILLTENTDYVLKAASGLQDSCDSANYLLGLTVWAGQDSQEEPYFADVCRADDGRDLAFFWDVNIGMGYVLDPELRLFASGTMFCGRTLRGGSFSNSCQQTNVFATQQQSASCQGKNDFSTFDFSFEKDNATGDAVLSCRENNELFFSAPYHSCIEYVLDKSNLEI